MGTLRHNIAQQGETRKLRPKAVEAMVFLIATFSAEQLTELVHLERVVRISTMKVSCESVLKELVGAMTVKCHVAYSPLVMHVEMIQEGLVFFFRSHFCEGHNLSCVPFQRKVTIRDGKTIYTKWSISIKRHACNAPHKKSTT